MLDLYKNIKQKRQELRMTQTELAQKTGYADKSMIARIENGQIDLSQSKIMAFADALNVSPAYLMGWKDAEPAKKQSCGSCEYYGRCHDRDAAEMTSKYLELDDIDRAKVAERIDTLLESEKYSSKEGLGSA